MNDLIFGVGFIGKYLYARLPKATILNLLNYTSLPGDIYQRVFYLATYGNMAHHNDKWETINANVGKPFIFLRWNPDLFIYMSSSSVTLPVQTAYSHSKRAGEEIIQASGVPACIIRPYSVTGVGEQKEHLIPALIRSCMEGGEMPFVPHATHDFIDVEDVVDAILFLADNKKTGIYEIGRGFPVANHEVLAVVQNACRKNAKIKVVDSLRSYDNQHWYCQNPIEGWRPKKTLLTSVAEMVEEYKRAH